MKMKKFGAIVLAGLMAVSLVGCGGNSSSKNEEKTYIIATDKTYPPFEMEDDSGKLVGVDMDLIRAIAKDQKLMVLLQVCQSMMKENKNMISQISTMKQVFQWVLQKIQVLKVMLI